MDQIQENKPEGSSLLEDLFFPEKEEKRLKKIENKAKKAENRANRELFADEDSSHESGSEDSEYEYCGFTENVEVAAKTK